jgi:hypothetical protein
MGNSNNGTAVASTMQTSLTGTSTGGDFLSNRNLVVNKEMLDSMYVSRFVPNDTGKVSKIYVP